MDEDAERPDTETVAVTMVQSSLVFTKELTAVLEFVGAWYEHALRRLEPDFMDSLEESAKGGILQPSAEDLEMAFEHGIEIEQERPFENDPRALLTYLVSRHIEELCRHFFGMEPFDPWLSEVFILPHWQDGHQGLGFPKVFNLDHPRCPDWYKDYVNDPRNHR